MLESKDLFRFFFSEHVLGFSVVVVKPVKPGLSDLDPSHAQNTTWVYITLRAALNNQAPVVSCYRNQDTGSGNISHHPCTQTFLF